MLLDLIPQKHNMKLGSHNIQLRLPLYSLLFCETKGYTSKDLLNADCTNDCIRTFYAASCVGALIKADDLGDFSVFENKEIKEFLDTAFETGLKFYIYENLIETWKMALPNVFDLTGKSGNDEIDYQHLRGFYCDMMQRPETDFWLSTFAEIYERQNTFAIIKGWKKAPTKIMEYDDDE